MAAGQFDLDTWLDAVCGVSAAAAPASMSPLRSVRRETPVPLAMTTGLPFNVTAGMRAERTILDPTGASRLIDLYSPAARLEVRTPGGGKPPLVLTSARLPTSASTLQFRVRLKKGTVWIRSDHLVPAASAAAYVGVPIESGTITFDTFPTVVRGAIKLGGTLEGKLTLNIQQPAPIPPTAEGCSGTGPVAWPQTLQLTFVAGELTAVRLPSGSAEVSGNTFEFAPTRTVSYLTDRRLILFEANVEPDRFDASMVSGELAEFAGTAPVVLAGWAFPLVALDPAHLGETSGPSWFLQCGPGARIRWIGTRTRETELGKFALTISPGRVMLSAAGATRQRPAVAQTLGLWLLRADEPRRIRAAFSFPKDFPLLYLCDAIEGEWLALLSEGSMLLDRPVDADGVPLRLEGGPALLQFRRRGDATDVSALQLQEGWDFDEAPAPLTPQRPLILGLSNVMMGTTPPLAAELQGVMADERSAQQGTLRLHFGVYGWIPTLPDPYVANIRPGGRRREARFGDVARRSTNARINAEIAWSPTEPVVVRFQGELGPPSGVERRLASELEPHGAPVNSRPTGVATQRDQGSVSRTEQAQERFDRQRDSQLRELSSRLESSTELDQNRERGLRALFARVGPGFDEGFALLDVSSNADQIGVELGVQQPRRAAGGSVSFILDGLHLKTPASNVRAFALPQVQWEPVRTLDIDQDIDTLGYFPTPLASATDGGASLLGVRSQRLVPAVPEIVVETVREEFQDGVPVGLITTLPFGLKVAVQLRPASNAGQLPDTLALTKPRFDAAELKGALQVTMTAGRNTALAATISPSFQGAAAQFLNGVNLATGVPLGISVLGGTKQPASTVESLFNNEFAPGGSNPSVPVTRFDVCGYGGSNFSDWVNPLAAFATATKVQFAVTVGRTAFEFVKFASVLYPWGIRTTRSVTVERRGGGGVVRRDTGWQPASDGLFDFAWTDTAGTPQPSPFAFHPGLLRGCFNITHLRPAAGPIVSFSGDGGRTVEVAPLYFDANVQIEGAEADRERVPAKGLLGYLHLKPPGVPLSAAELAKVIALQSPIGGPIDCTINADRSGFRVRGVRAEVAAAEEPGFGPRFVGTVRCVPRFAQSGAWAVARMAGAGGAPGDATSIDEARGLPIIRQGRMKANPTKVDVPTGFDLRFADPEDLFRPSTPAFDYGFLQTSSAHAFLFRRPYIAAGATEIRSSLVPCFADPFARLSSKGVFPSIEAVIPLPQRTLILNAGTGAFRLSSPINLPSPRGPLGSSPAGDGRARIFYDEATLQTDIQEQMWSVDFAGIGTWIDMLGVEKFSGTKSRIVASESQRPQVREITTHFHPDFEDVLSFIPGFGNRGIHGPIDLGASNDGHENRYTLEIHKKIDLVHPPPGIVGPKVELELLYTFEAGVTSHENARHVMIGSRLGAELQVKLPVSLIFFVIIGLEFEAGMKDLIADAQPAKGEIELQAYIGFGAQLDFGVAKGHAFLAVGIVVVYESGHFKAGGLVKLEAEAEVLKIVTVQIAAELKGFLRDSKAPEPIGKKACDYKGEVGINVEICFLISIEFTHEFEGSKVL